MFFTSTLKEITALVGRNLYLGGTRSAGFGCYARLLQKSLLVHANKRSNATMDNADAPTIKLISRNGDEFEL